MACQKYYVVQKLKQVLETEYEEDWMDAADIEAFKGNIRGVLAYIEDDMILSVSRMTPEHRVFLFRLKYGREADVCRRKDKTALVWNEKCVYCQDDTYTLFEFIDYEGAMLRLEITVSIFSCAEERERYSVKGIFCVKSRGSCRRRSIGKSEGRVFPICYSISFPEKNLADFRQSVPGRRQWGSVF